MVRKFNIGELENVWGCFENFFKNDHIFDRFEIMKELNFALSAKAKKLLKDTNFKVLLIDFFCPTFYPKYA